MADNTVQDACAMYSEYMAAEPGEDKKEWLDLIISTFQKDPSIMRTMLRGQTVLDMALQTENIDLIHALASMLDNKDPLLERARFFAKRLGMTSVEWSKALYGKRVR